MSNTQKLTEVLAGSTAGLPNDTTTQQQVFMRGDGAWGVPGARRRLDNSRGNDRKAMASPPTVGASTTVSGSNALNSAAINVVSTTGFPSSGTLTIAAASVTYTGKTGTSFTGCGAHAAYTGGEAVSITQGTSTGITSGIVWPSVKAVTTTITQLGEHFTYHGGASPAVFGTVFPNYLYVSLNSLTTVNSVSAPYVISFYFDGTQLELLFKGSSGFMMVKVDDEYVSLTPTTIPNDGSTYFQPITFASRLVRRVDIITSTFLFGGVQTGPNDTIVPAETRGPRMIVLGDSFTEGTGADAGHASNWVRTFADLMGWDDVWPSGVGGTGYLNPATGGKVKFRDRVAHDVIAYNPDIVVVAGGHNDYAYNPGGGVVTSAQIGAEAAALFAQIKAGLPNALLVVTSPFWHQGPSTQPAALVAARDAIQAAAVAVGATFLDVMELPLPSYLTPISTTLSSSSLAAAASVSLPVGLSERAVLKIGTDRAEVKTITGGGPFTHNLDGTLTNAHTAGDAVTQIGPSLWTGTGRVGATSGYGNSDLIVGSDGIHPTQAGHNILGTTLARLLLRSGTV